MGFWNALTLQGKLAIAAAVLGGLFLLSLAYGDGNDTPESDGPGFSTAVIQGQTAPTNTVVSRVQTPATGVPGSSTAPAGSPTPPGPTETPETAISPTTSAPTAVPTSLPTLIPTAVPVQDTPVPPTPTTPAGCQVQASVSNGNSVDAQLVCAGAPGGAGAAMTASFIFENLSTGCSGATSSTGAASCSVSPGASAGALRSVDVCIASPTGRVCTSVQ